MIRLGTLRWLPLSLVVLAPFFARAENWPQWRGARLDGVSEEADLPTEWSATENIAWRLPLPGPGGSTPVVWGDRIFLTTSDGGEDIKLLCVGTGGEKLWEQTLGGGNQVVRGDEGNYASNSPCTDGQHVWAMAANGPLACYDFEGNEVWKIDLAERYGKFNIAFGLSSTPVLDGDRLYLQLIHTGGAYVVALDTQSGSEIWKHDRQSDATDECEHSYASPVLYRDAEREFLLTHGADYIIAHRLNDGAEIWRCGGLNPPPNSPYRPDFRFVASPVAVPGLIVVPSCKEGLVIGLRPTGKGDITAKPRMRAWQYENTPDVPSPLVHDGLVYLCDEGGVLTCLEADSGEVLYSERTHADRHRASPVYGDGKLYLTARDGTVSVVKAGREFELLATNALDEAIAASPAIAGGKIYLRTYDALYCIGAE